MAQFFPSIEKIKLFAVSPTEGEWALLRFLEQTLDDSFVVYFNPFKRDRIRVTFTDGHTICEKVNKDTLTAVITRIGVEDVYNLRLNAWGNGSTPLMSESPIIGYEKFCVKLAPNRYLLTNSTTNYKIETMQRISNLLNLDLKIELLEGANKTSKNN